MENKSRRSFLKKSAYVVPTLVALGTLSTPAEASPRNSHIERGHYGDKFKNFTGTKKSNDSYENTYDEDEKNDKDD